MSGCARCGGPCSCGWADGYWDQEPEEFISSGNPNLVIDLDAFSQPEPPEPAMGPITVTPKPWHGIFFNHEADLWTVTVSMSGASIDVCGLIRDEAFARELGGYHADKIRKYGWNKAERMYRDANEPSPRSVRSFTRIHDDWQDRLEREMSQ